MLSSGIGDEEACRGIGEEEEGDRDTQYLLPDLAANHITASRTF